MRAQTLPANAGWRWLREGYALYRQNPAILMMLVATYWLSLLALGLIPILGTVATYLAMPVLGVGLMNACRDLAWRRTVLPAALFSGRQQNLPTLLLLGGAYLACVLGAIAVTTLIDGGELMRFLLASKPSDREDLESGLLAPLVLTALLIPVAMAWWFAPVLAAWHGFKAPKALFFSLVACWVNWRAFLVYGLGIFFYAAVLPALALLLIGGLVPGAGKLLILTISLPLLMVLMPVVFASFYIIYRDVFGVDEIV